LNQSFGQVGRELVFVKINLEEHGVNSADYIAKHLKTFVSDLFAILERHMGQFVVLLQGGGHTAHAVIRDITFVQDEGA
jgi:hypothetical protein